MLILAIETTCDETAVALAEVEESDKVSGVPKFKLLANEIVSQAELHRVFGGIVPEVASRKHQETMLPLLITALSKLGRELEPDLIAVSLYPGLIGAILIGVATAKALAVAWSKPFVGVNHLWAHLYACFLEHQPRFPFIGLVLSGGHTNMYLFEDHFKVRLLGRTLDDAIGEAFDKAARLLRLDYPGGPLIDKLAREGEPKYRLPLAMSGADELDFSYSGLKTALSRLVARLRAEGRLSGELPNLASSFQVAAIEQVINKIKLAVKLTGVRTLILGGGVVANTYLRERLSELQAKLQLELLIPPKELCIDNAAMLIPLAYYQYKLFGPTPLKSEAYPSEEAGLRAILDIRL